MPSTPPNDPKAPARGTEHDRTERDRADPSRKSTGPNNPLPGEPGGPSTSGHVEAEEHDDDKARGDRDPKARDNPTKR